jgi:hypothetical protein
MCHVAAFYKPTIPQSTPSHLRDCSTCNNARFEFSTIFVPSFDPNEWCLKNGLHSGGGHFFFKKFFLQKSKPSQSSCIVLQLITVVGLNIFFII